MPFMTQNNPFIQKEYLFKNPILKLYYGTFIALLNHQNHYICLTKYL